MFVCLKHLAPFAEKVLVKEESEDSSKTHSNTIPTGNVRPWGFPIIQSSQSQIAQWSEREEAIFLPTVGVVAALKELVDDIEEVLSARARGAIGGGLEECTGGLKGLGWGRKERQS